MTYLIKKQFFMTLLAFLFLGACAVNKKKPQEDPRLRVAKATPYGRISEVSKAIPTVENIREIPNGEIIGETRKGEKFKLIGRYGNWVRVRNADFKDGYIWAPSFGYRHIDLYKLSTWYDTHEKAFYALSQYQNILGKASGKVDYFGNIRLVYDMLGLGFEEVITMDMSGKETVEKKAKGVGLVISEASIVFEISIEFKNALTNYQQLEEKLKIALGQPTSIDQSQVVWENKYGLSKVRLLRKEFDSPQFGQVVLVK
jgi:hypothetical protein